MLVRRWVSAAGGTFPLDLSALGVFWQRRQANWAVFVTTPQLRLGRLLVLRNMQPWLFIWFHDFRSLRVSRSSDPIRDEDWEAAATRRAALSRSPGP